MGQWGAVSQAQTVEARGAPPVVRVAGRLVAIRIGRLSSRAQVLALEDDVRRAMNASGSPRSDWIICVDCRDAAPLPREVADAWCTTMRRANPRIERSAILVDPPNAMFNLQVERVVRCAGSPARKVFDDLDDALRWLEGAGAQGQSLGPTERDDLRRFLTVS